MVRLGIIGLGHMGGYHANACTLIPNIELVGIADISTETWSKVKIKNIIKTGDYRKWIDKVDAAIIAVPTEFHYDIAKDCLNRGKHILLEKPLTKTIEQARELFRIAKQKNLSLHVGHVERFNGAVQELKNVVHNPYLIECHRIGPFSSRVQKDSVVLDLMIHDLDIILNLVEAEPQSISAIGNKIKTDQGDIAIVQIKFDNGVLANIVSSRVSQIKKRSMSIHQPDSFIHLDFSTQDIAIHSNTHESVKIGSKALRYRQEGTVKRLFVYNENPLKLEIEHFMLCFLYLA